ncbi:hypothetical protein LguiA_030089 [Lonicera macranthoides]
MAQCAWGKAVAGDDFRDHMGIVIAFFIFVLSAASLFLLWTLTRFLHKVWWTPICIQKKLESQGIKGLPYKFPHGNTKLISNMRNQSMDKPMEISHDMLFARIQPHVYLWKKMYGKSLVAMQLFKTERNQWWNWVLTE